MQDQLAAAPKASPRVGQVLAALLVELALLEKEQTSKPLTECLRDAHAIASIATGLVQ